MDTQNIFDDNVDRLVAIRDEVVACDELENKKKQLMDRSDRMKKAIAQEDKSINDEINQTIKKRKQEVEKTYDDQLDASRKKVKRAQDKKNKEKSERVGQRVEEETADVKESSRQLKIELKTLFKKNHVPAFCQTYLYYALFSPKGFQEVMTLLLGIIIGLGAFPFGMYMLFSRVVFAGKLVFNVAAETSPVLMVITIALSLIIVMGLYFLIFNLTKVRYRDVIAEGRLIRNQMHANDKNVKAIKNAINKDKDESQYELGEYDAEIEKYQAETEGIAKQKQDALTEFEQYTKKTISDEIKGRRMSKLESMKSQQQAVEEEAVEAENQYKAAALAITDNYVKYLGKGICKAEALNDIIEIMNEEEVTTISEGIAIYKGEAPKKQKTQ